MVQLIRGTYGNNGVAARVDQYGKSRGMLRRSCDAPPFFATGSEPVARVTLYLTDQNTLKASFFRPSVVYNSVTVSYREK